MMSSNTIERSENTTATDWRPSSRPRAVAKPRQPRLASIPTYAVSSVCTCGINAGGSSALVLSLAVIQSPKCLCHSGGFDSAVRPKALGTGALPFRTVLGTSAPAPASHHIQPSQPIHPSARTLFHPSTPSPTPVQLKQFSGCAVHHQRPTPALSRPPFSTLVRISCRNNKLDQVPRLSLQRRVPSLQSRSLHPVRFCRQDSKAKAQGTDDAPIPSSNYDPPSNFSTP